MSTPVPIAIASVTVGQVVTVCHFGCSVWSSKPVTVAKVTKKYVYTSNNIKIPLNTESCWSLSEPCVDHNLFNKK